MKLWIDDVFLEVTFDKGLKVYFKLYNNDLTYRWINLVNQCNNENNKINSNYFKIFSQKEIEMLFEDLCDTIELINTVHERKIPSVESLKWLISNPKILNDLHEEYEIYGDKPNHIINDEMQKLNDLIHIFENIIAKRKTFFCCVNYETKKFENLKYEDYFLFSESLEWGYVYLGYNTLGKNWREVLFTDDVEAVERKQIRPQTTFSSEYYLHFNQTLPHNIKNKFYNWWTKNDFSKIYENKFTIEDFAFGNIPLGKIAYYDTNDELDISPDNKLIYEVDSINTPEAILEWNKNIWSSQNSVIKTQFVKAF